MSHPKYTSLTYPGKSLDDALLLLYGADQIDVNLGSPRCDSPLSCAIRKQSQETVELLLEAGADVNQYHTLYQRPLYQAVSVGATEIVRLLLTNGAEVNHVHHVTGAGTALCRAAECGSVPVAELLLRHGADVTLGSPLSSAAWRRGNNAMADLLLALM